MADIATASAKGKAEEILAEYMLKRSVNKSTLFSNENYKERWFVLDNDNLKYFDGSLGVSSNSTCMGLSGIVLQFLEGALGPFRLGKLACQTPKLGNLL